MLSNMASKGTSKILHIPFYGQDICLSILNDFMPLGRTHIVLTPSQIDSSPTMCSLEGCYGRLEGSSLYRTISWIIWYIFALSSAYLLPVCGVRSISSTDLYSNIAPTQFLACNVCNVGVST